MATGAPDGLYSFTYRGWADGVVYGASIDGSVAVGAASTFALLDAGGIASAEAFGAATFSFSGAPTPVLFSIADAGGIPSQETFGATRVVFDGAAASASPPASRTLVIQCESRQLAIAG